jgi:hypothetical protein
MSFKSLVKTVKGEQTRNHLLVPGIDGSAPVPNFKVSNSNSLDNLPHGSPIPVRTAHTYFFASPYAVPPRHEPIPVAL